MVVTERQRDPVTAAPPDGGTPAGNATRTRKIGEDFLSAADEAISRGLSVDSVAFLESTTQEGGQ
ncbi:MAG: hypothetical protein IT428_01755 [Planctomycetaceae bacterium]|nr:hypothetical protein [Planctomycetaceae bacterium]